MTSHQNSASERPCLCGNPHADHQQTPDGAAECDMCGDVECVTCIAAPAWATVFLPRACPRCREQHPGQSCPLHDAAQQLPLEEE